MKRIAWLLVVLLLLTACGTRRQEEQEAAPGETVQTEEPAPAAETPPAQEASPAPEAPAEPEEPAESEEPAVPEEPAEPEAPTTDTVPAEEVPFGLTPITPVAPEWPGDNRLNPTEPPVYELPVEPPPQYETESVSPGQARTAGAATLPRSAYCFEDTAVDGRGRVVLRLPGHTLTPVTDAATGQPRGIAARETGSGLVTTLYDLAGQPLLTGLQADTYGCQSDLFWYGRTGSYTLQRISTEQVLETGLAEVQPVGDRLALQPAFWNSSCRLVDGLGQTTAELDRGFRLSGVHTWQDQSYLTVTSKDGLQTLVDTEGNSCLGRFYDEVAGITGGCALVRDGGNWLAVSLNGGRIMFRWTAPFTLLTGGVLAELPSGGYQLVNRQGRQLCQTFSSARVYTGGGTELVFGQLVRNGAYGTVVLDAGGTELAFLPAELFNVTPVDGNTVFYTTASGKEAFDRTGFLRKLDTGVTVEAASGAFLSAEAIETTRGTMVLCVSGDDSGGAFTLVLPDGTPVLTGQTTCAYQGGDVLVCEKGLLTLDGQWLYQVKEGAVS